MSDAVDVPEENNDVSLTPERKAALNIRIECDQNRTVDELLYMAACYESLAMRVATRRSS